MISIYNRYKDQSLLGEHGLPVYHSLQVVHVLPGKLRDFSEILSDSVRCRNRFFLPHIRYDGGYPCRRPCRRPGLSGRFPLLLYPDEVFDHGDDARSPDSYSVFLVWGFH